MKILITGNQARAMSNFWTVLIRRMVRLGHDLLCVVPADASPEETAWREKLSTLGVRLALYPLDRKGLNPFADIRTLCSLRSIIAGEQPDVFFAYTIKPVIYGSLAAALAGAPPKARRFVMITGLGYTFEADSGLKRLLMRVTARLYRTAFARSGTVFFQNGDDRALFERLAIVPPGVAVRLTRGTGVDLEYFGARPKAEGPPMFLFVGRLLEAKGLRDFMKAAALVRRRRPEARFAILGPEEKGPGAVPLAEVLACQDKGLVRYLGTATDVRPHLEAATAVVLPSWREGTPCSLLEAMATARAVIAADAPGSREVTRQQVNGLLVPVRDAAALAEAMERLAEDRDLAARMGLAGRKLAEEEFSAEAVASDMLSAMGLRE